MRAIADGMRKDPEIGRAIVDDIDIIGVEKLEDAVVVVRCRLKVVPPAQARVRSEFLIRMKRALETLAGNLKRPDTSAAM
jgi:small conductance mechanosensitive channel